MNRISRSFGLLAVVALAAASAFASGVADVAATVVRAARDRVLGWLEVASAPFKRQADWTDLARPPVPLVQARAFVMRLAKRQRPITTPRWRMCPST